MFYQCPVCGKNRASSPGAVCPLCASKSGGSRAQGWPSDSQSETTTTRAKQGGFFQPPTQEQTDVSFPNPHQAPAFGGSGGDHSVFDPNDFNQPVTPPQQDGRQTYDSGALSVGIVRNIREDLDDLTPFNKWMLALFHGVPYSRDDCVTLFQVYPDFTGMNATLGGSI